MHRRCAAARGASDEQEKRSQRYALSAEYHAHGKLSCRVLLVPSVRILETFTKIESPMWRLATSVYSRRKRDRAKNATVGSCADTTQHVFSCYVLVQHTGEVSTLHRATGEEQYGLQITTANDNKRPAGSELQAVRINRLESHR